MLAEDLIASRFFLSFLFFQLQGHDEEGTYSGWMRGNMLEVGEHICLSTVTGTLFSTQLH